MDVFTAISNRRSIRAYSDRPVEEDELQRVLEAAELGLGHVLAGRTWGTSRTGTAKPCGPIVKKWHQAEPVRQGMPF